TVAVANGVAVFGWQRPWLRPIPRAATRAAIRRVCSLGLVFFALQLSRSLDLLADNLVAAQVLGAGTVPQYAVPLKLFVLPSSIIALFQMPLWPAYGEAAARGDRAWIARTARRSFTVSLLASLPAALTLAVFGRTILRLWVG